MKRLWWYPYDEPTNSTLRSVADILSAPAAREKFVALRGLGANAMRSLHAKI